MHVSVTESTLLPQPEGLRFDSDGGCPTLGSYFLFMSIHCKSLHGQAFKKHYPFFFEIIMELHHYLFPFFLPNPPKYCSLCFLNAQFPLSSLSVHNIYTYTHNHKHRHIDIYTHIHRHIHIIIYTDT